MSTLLSDDFDRANNADLGANWGALSNGVQGGNSMQIVSNAVVLSVASDSSECHVTTVPVDHWAEVTLGGSLSAGQGAGYGPITRSTAAGSNFGYYRFCASNNGWEITEWGNSVFVGSLATAASPTWAGGDRVYGESVGNVHTLRKNTTNGLGGTFVGSANDATLASNVRVGIGYSTTDANATIASWLAGDFDVVPPPADAPLQIMGQACL